MTRKRICGGCSLCCKVMGVPEIKADHEWCAHAKLGGGGCKIYPDRPERCRDFLCQWLIDDRYPEYWYPRHAKIVIDIKLIEGRKFVIFVVDPAYPTRWRETPWFDDIKKIARAGLLGLAGQRWRTVISIKGEEIPVVLESPVKLTVGPASGSVGVKTP
jgi:hypothetical protein